MTDRDALVAAIAARPGEDTPRLALADWLEEQGQPGRAEFARAQCAAARLRPGTARRADLLDRADDLLAEHGGEWLGAWHGRLVDWEFRRGFLARVRMTAADFLRHGDELFGAEPVGTLELVDATRPQYDGSPGPLTAETVREVVAHPAFARVRDCAVVTAPFLRHTPVDAWLAAMAANPHVTHLRRFGPTPGDSFQYDGHPNTRTDGLTEEAVAGFCRAGHLRTLRRLELMRGPNEYAPGKPWLVPLLAGAVFARSLRRLTLVGWDLTADDINRVAADPAFGNLRALDLSGNADDPDAWAAVFHSTTLTKVRTLAISANHLPAYSRSPTAARVTDLTVHTAGDLERDMTPDREAWRELIDHAPPPRRLVLRYHNPGRGVFAAMRHGAWLRNVRELSVSGDSQYEVYAGRTAGLRTLFGPRTMPRLARLRLHEACDSRLLAALGPWRGAERLESLELTDDYHGRLLPGGFDPEYPPEALRRVRGVVVTSDQELERFLAWPRLERLEHLTLSFAGEYNRRSREFTEVVTPAAAARLVRSDRLANVTELAVGFHHVPKVQARLVQVLADPTVMPRLRRVRVHNSGGSRPQPAAGLRARFGPRLRLSLH